MKESATWFNLKAVIHETGLNAETLRAWERRYGLPKPQRTPGGHRLYSLHDIHTLNWLAARQREGISISRAVELWRSLETEGQNPLLSQPIERPLPFNPGAMLDEMRSAWVEACLLFDERRAESQLSQAFALHPPEVVCSELLVKGIAEIGSRWYAGAASVQQEHFATSLAMRRLYTLAGSSPAPTRPGRILAACPAGEEHEFGLLFFTVLLRRRGWDVVYLGASVPLLRLESALQAAAPFLVLSVALTLPAAAALQEMGYLLKKSGLLLAYGGGIFNQLPALQHTIPGFLLGNDFSQASQLIEELWSHKPPVIEPLPPSPEHREALQHYHENASQIEADVQDALREDSIHPHHLEVANSALRQHLTAALSLGDIRLLTASITWVEGLLINHGLPRELILHYLNTYLQAIHRRLPQSDQPVFAPLVHLTWSMP